MTNKEPSFTDKVCGGSIDECPLENDNNIKEFFKNLLPDWYEKVENSSGKNVTFMQLTRDITNEIMPVTDREKDAESFKPVDKIRKACEAKDCPHLTSSDSYILRCTRCGEDLVRVDNKDRSDIAQFKDSLCPYCKLPTITELEGKKGDIYKVDLYHYYVHYSEEHTSGMITISLEKPAYCCCAKWTFQGGNPEDRTCKHLRNSGLLKKVGFGEVRDAVIRKK